MKVLTYILLLSLLTFSFCEAPRKLIFDSFFQWQKADFTITKQGASGSNDFTAAVNSNERGIYLRLEDETKTSNADFIDEVAYVEEANGIEAIVLDFQLMDCQFKDVSSWFAKKFLFTLRTYNKEGRTLANYTILAVYKMGSKLFGGLNLESIIATLTTKCLARKTYIANKLAEEAKLQEQKRIEAEQLKKLEEEKATEKKKAEEAAEAAKKQAEEESQKQADEQKEAEKKKEDELKAQEDAANKKKAEEEAQKKAEEEGKKKAEEEAAKNAEELSKKAKDEIDKDEKKYVKTVQTLEVQYNTGFGFAVFITGQDELLGSWETSYRLTPTKDDLWTFKLPEGIKDGAVFKTLVARWDEGESFKMSDAFNNRRPVYWENPQGAQGNKVMKFQDFLMSYVPSYPRS